MLGVILAAALLLVGAERLARLRFRKLLLFRPYFLTDVLYLFVGQVVLDRSLIIAYFVTTSAWVGMIFNVGRISETHAPFWLLVPLALLMLDFSTWCVHVALHRSKVLWEFHKV